MAKRSKNPLAQARLAALSGDVDAALPVLMECAGAGDASAAASAAEVLAYLDRWADVIAHAGALIANPFAVYAGNVFDDMVRLLGRAGAETGNWPSVAATAEAASASVTAALDANAFNYSDVKIAAARRELITKLDHLAQHARTGQGDGFEELIKIFGIAPEPPNRAAYDAAIATKKNQPPARRVSLAIVFGIEEELMALYPQLAQPLVFDQVLHVARAFVRHGKKEQAWQAIEANWPAWYPVDHAQVAPVELLSDALLAPLMTRERCTRLIRTARAGK